MKTYVIAHPEALVAKEYLEAKGVRFEGTFDPVGPALTVGMGVERAVPAEPFIVLNGSGNFHHETLPLLESVLRQRKGELLYIQIDAHPDTRPMFRWIVDCTSFVGRVLENKRVRSVYLLGQYPDAITDPGQRGPVMDKLGYFRCDYFAKFNQYLVGPSAKSERYSPVFPEAEAAARRNPAIRRVRKARSTPENPTLLIDWHTLADFRPEDLPNLPVYLTIDLDVVRDRPVTDWRRKADREDGVITPNQGDMSFSTLVALVESIGRNRKIIGADFCGLLQRTTWLRDERLEDSLAAVAETHAALARAIELGN
ncbi:MAG: hypothetical protein HY791_08760 [Deltaproteobacteria bacterium]|nr:hypothetical protein [Deltaproteobacteria bacterium]